MKSTTFLPSILAQVPPLHISRGRHTRSYRALLLPPFRPGTCELHFDAPCIQRTFCCRCVASAPHSRLVPRPINSLSPQATATALAESAALASRLNVIDVFAQAQARAFAAARNTPQATQVGGGSTIVRKLRKGLGNAGAGGSERRGPSSRAIA